MRRIVFAMMVALLSGTVVSAQEKGTRVSVIGDSYSTFEGFMTPATNELWYYCKTRDNTDVDQVQETWWWQLIKEQGWKLECNNSYSGATIGYHGYSGNDYSARSFITRMNNLGSPDLIFIFGGTNDSWAGEPAGEYKWENWGYGDFYTFRPAMAYLLQAMQLRYPNVGLYVLINDGLRDDITESMKVICDHYGVKYIQLKDIKKQSGHPNVEGMKQIAEQIKIAMEL